jgi:hypothetical protein
LLNLAKRRALKLPILLTQYLYKYKNLNLPGIGSFTLDPSAILPDDHSKNPHEAASGIEFSTDFASQPDPELIEFIRIHTGKIKPLAVADLDSFLTLGFELLNIGKPFYLEGIGALTKGQEGRIEFSPGEYTVTRVEDPRAEGHKHTRKKQIVHEEPHYEPERQQPAGSRKLIVTLAIFIGLIIIGWGGYQLYKKNSLGSAERDIAVVDAKNKEQDSIRNMKIADSLDASQKKLALARTMGDSSVMKFIILRTHNKEHALKRYNQLLSFNLKINLETLDSSYFKIYFSFPALMKDTVHIKDSLEREYAHKVVIEK